MMKQRMLGILLALALCLGCLGTVGVASAEEEAKVTRFQIGVIEDAGNDYYVKIFFADAVLGGVGGSNWVTGQYGVLKDKISVNGAKLSAAFAAAQFGDVHWVDDGTEGSSHLRIQFMKRSGDNLYGDGLLHTAATETNVIVLEEGIAAPSGVKLPGLTLTLNGVGGAAIDSSMTDCYTQTGTEPEQPVEPAEPQRLRFNIGAIGEIETDYYLKLFFHGDLLVNNELVTNQFDELKDKISVNGRTLAEILTPRQFGNVHWVKEGASDILRIDFMKGSAEHPDGDGVLEEDNVVELEQGIVAPNGNILPKLKVWLKKDKTPTSALEHPGRVREAVQDDVAAGELTVRNVTPIVEADGGENFAFNVIFGETVAEEQLINQWNNFYLCDTVKINGWTFEQIFGGETVNAVNAHWIVTEDYPGGYLSVSMKTAMIDDCAIRRDGSDVLELLPGLRSANNLELKTAHRFIYNGTAWVDDVATLSAADLSMGAAGEVVDLTFDVPAANDANADAEVDAGKLTLNGEALPQGATTAWAKSGDRYVLRLTLPAGTLQTGKNTLALAAGFELANGYRVEAAQQKELFVKAVTAIAATAPAKTAYAFGERLDLAGAKLTVTYNDGTSEEIAVTAAMVSGFDAQTPGEQTVTVAYEGKTATFRVTVAEQASEPAGGCKGALDGGTMGGVLLLAACGALAAFRRRRRQK